MRIFAGALAVAALLSFGLLTYTPVANAAGMDAGAAKTIKGEVLKIDGENYTVKDDSGKEVTLHVNKDTKKAGDIKVGDKIEAEADATGHAQSIKAAR